jgi:hypothetical protein
VARQAQRSTSYALTGLLEAEAGWDVLVPPVGSSHGDGSDVSSTKKPKMTVSRFMPLLSGQTAGAWSPMLEVSSCLTPGWDRDLIA